MDRLQSGPESLLRRTRDGLTHGFVSSNLTFKMLSHVHKFNAQTNLTEFMTLCDDFFFLFLLHAQTVFMILLNFLKLLQFNAKLTSIQCFYVFFTLTTCFISQSELFTMVGSDDLN